jgi:hypothetical protein
MLASKGPGRPPSVRAGLVARCASISPRLATVKTINNLILFMNSYLRSINIKENIENRKLYIKNH